MGALLVLEPPSGLLEPPTRLSGAPQTDPLPWNMEPEDEVTVPHMLGPDWETAEPKGSLDFPDRSELSGVVPRVGVLTAAPEDGGVTVLTLELDEEDTPICWRIC